MAHSGVTGEENSNLAGNPRGPTLGSVAFDIGVDEPLLKSVGGPSILQELNVEFLSLDSPRLADDLTEGLVIRFARSPVESPYFVARRDATSDELLDIDMFDTAVGPVVLEVDGDSSDRDGLPLEPAHALKGEDFLSAVGEGLVLKEVRGDASFSC